MNNFLINFRKKEFLPKTYLRVLNISLLNICLLLIGTSAHSQAKLNLHLLPDGKTISVGIIPEVTWAPPKNMVGSSQIVLHVSSATAFVPGIVSKIDGLHWMDNYYVENPPQDSGCTYICIALVESATTKIPFNAGEETVLFEVKNTAGDCPGLVEVLDNNDPRVQAVRASGYNVTQNCAVLGAGKNAITGIKNGTINCITSGLNKENLTFQLNSVRLFPSPADQDLQISWNNPENIDGNIFIIICDASGKEIERRTVSGQMGEGSQTFRVKSWVSGLYSCRFSLNDGRKSKAWNFVVMHS